MLTLAPLVFVDFDGVLTTANYQRAGGRALDPSRVRLLAELVGMTGAYIVVTSSWRGSLTEMRRLLKAAGLRNARRVVIGVTPFIAGGDRGDEIAAYLAPLPHPPPRLCILDDDADMGAYLPKLVCTDPQQGLTQRDVDRAWYLLA